MPVEVEVKKASEEPVESTEETSIDAMLAYLNSCVGRGESNCVISGQEKIIETLSGLLSKMEAFEVDQASSLTELQPVLKQHTEGLRRMKSDMLSVGNMIQKMKDALKREFELDFSEPSTEPLELLQTRKSRGTPVESEK
ncbi:hypothetical protein J8273_5937 [Carpediemonas membranifera]|uniref:Uncharacterized protein n=1 Tax=Carpediemonas membranifera TaxID=201153 RepID=A0A8J6DYS5_9EUKA|nr:hypothetical protein J8273_5937 [Carpediemonas membranifera]|eukprot:KAG9392679.1 hypothetical protein J8273_5937 [Carpediemonas membranifera]